MTKTTFEFSNSFRKRRKYISEAHQANNRVVVLYFQTSLFLFGTIVLKNYEENQVIKKYSEYRQMIEQDKY